MEGTPFGRRWLAPGWGTGQRQWFQNANRRLAEWQGGGEMWSGYHTRRRSRARPSHGGVSEVPASFAVFMASPALGTLTPAGRRSQGKGRRPIANTAPIKLHAPTDQAARA